jgi:hypothetical protein
MLHSSLSYFPQSDSSCFPEPEGRGCSTFSLCLALGDDSSLTDQQVQQSSPIKRKSQGGRPLRKRCLRRP